MAQTEKSMSMGRGKDSVEEEIEQKVILSKTNMDIYYQLVRKLAQGSFGNVLLIKEKDRIGKKFRRFVVGKILIGKENKDEQKKIVEEFEKERALNERLSEGPVSDYVPKYLD